MSKKKKTFHEGFKKTQRAAEILSVFAKHNFYTGGFTPVELRTTLEDLGPTYVKLGQIMSSRTDILPQSYCKELEKLRNNVKPLDAQVVRQVIEEETGKKIEEIYSEFLDKPIGSASIAQAHYAVLIDGTKVVTKVQRPQVADMMRKDFVILKRLAAAVNTVGEVQDGIEMMDLHSVLSELEKVTEDELDFRVEAANTRKFKEQCIENSDVIDCPEVIDELTTQRILTLTYVDGYSISHKDRVEEEGFDRVEIGKAIVENYMHQLLDVGLFHGDPHQGNIMISRGKPYWIDFGMLGYISEKSMNSIQQMVLALMQKDVEGMTNAALAIGKVNGNLNKSRLMDDIDAFIEKHLPSLNNLSGIDIGEVFTDLTQILMAHHISVPGEYTMLVRSVVTLEGVIESFCPELKLIDFLTQKMLQRARDSFDLKEKLLSLLETLASTGINTVRLPMMAADALKNLVKGRMKVNIELTGYDELFKNLNELVSTIMLSIFSCVLFMGSCILCTTDLAPRLHGVPLVAFFGFVVSVALALYCVINMLRRK